MGLKVAYALWLFGGLWGAHHFFLGDDIKAFLYAISFGGCGIGFLRDLWRLPAYVRESSGVSPIPSQNGSHNAKPKSFFLLLGLWSCSYYFARLGSLAFAPPWMSHVIWATIVRSVCSALGAYLVAVSSFHRTVTVSFRQLLAVAAGTSIALQVVLPFLDTYPWASVIPSPTAGAALACAVLAYKGRLYLAPGHVATRKASRGCCGRLIVLSLSVFAFGCCIGLAFALNATAEVNGEKVLLAKNFSQFLTKNQNGQPRVSDIAVRTARLSHSLRSFQDGSP
jgi:hypothetical protein